MTLARRQAPAVPHDPPAEAVVDDDLRERAWALQRACLAAWTTDPQDVQRAASELRRLADAEGAQPTTPGWRELQALADWTEGIAHLTQGRLEPACAALDRAAQAFQRLQLPLRVAETTVPKIMALTLLGRSADAARCGEEAQRVFVAHGHMLPAAKVSLNLGSLHLRCDAADEAARHYRAAAVRFARVGHAQYSVMADVGLADALTAQGHLAEAGRIVARARERARAHGLPMLSAMVDETAALLALVGGRYRDALEGLERSRRAYEALQMPQQLAVADKQLADAYLELRLLPEALALYTPAVQRFAELEMPAEQAWTLVQQGRAWALSGRAESAHMALAQAAELFDAQAVPSGRAAVALARAELCLGRGELADAAALIDTAVDGYAGAGSTDGQLRARVLRGRVLLAQGEPAAAQSTFDQVLQDAVRHGLLGLQGAALSGAAQAAEAEGRVVDARAGYERAVALAEAQRRALPGDEIRSAFLADHLLPYRGLLKLALADGDAVDVLRRLDAFRARALADRLGQGGSTDDASDDDGLRARLNWLYRREQRALVDGEDVQALAPGIRQIEGQLLERGRRRRLAESPQHPDIEPPLDLHALHQGLGHAGALVAYGVEGDELFACVVTGGRVVLRRRLASWSDVRTALRSLRFQLDTVRAGADALAAHLPLLARRAQVRLQQVHQLLWAPLAADLQAASRVLVVPHGPLATVPFAALNDGELPLVVQHQLAMVPSVRVALHGLRRLPAVPRQVMAFGHAPQLPHVEQEALQVAARHVGGQACIGAGATVAALAARAPAVDLLHLACHAQFRGDSPMFSALHLADGALTAEAVERWRLGPCTVVLSACDTALSAPDAGDDRVGLVRAFRVAGAARVIASLWPVDDARTEPFMQRLHAALASGLGPAAALQATQVALWRDGAAPGQPVHPAYWAAFTLHGGW